MGSNTGQNQAGTAPLGSQSGKRLITSAFAGISPKQQALGQAIAIGLGAGMAVTGFRLLMGAIGTWRNQMSFGAAGHAWALPAIGLVGGAIAGLMVQRLAPEAKGSGIPYVKLALARPTTPMRWRAIWVKAVSAAIGIGAGLSLGREGPSVQIGAGMGALVGTAGERTRAHRRQMLAAGAGAGLAAAFNAPIAGVLFVVEEMLQEFSSLTLGTAILASVTAAVVARLIGGGAFIYHLPKPEFSSLQLPLYGVLGLACGLLGPLFSWSLLRSLALSRRIAAVVPKPLQTAIVGGLTGLVGLRFPEILGGSYDLVEHSLFGTIGLVVLPIMFLAKLACTSLAYGSGAAGGIFSPSLVLGALVGLGVGEAAHLTMPMQVPSTEGFAFAGMGAYFAATARAPITATVLVFELTGSYSLILPLMLSVVVATLVSELSGQESIYHALLRNDGVTLEAAPSLGTLADRPVREAMTSRPEVVHADDALPQLIAMFAASRHNGFPIVDVTGALVGVLTKDDLLDALEHQAGDTMTAREIGSLPGIRISADATLAEAWEILARERISRLAVVAHDDPNKLMGVLTRVDLFQHVSSAA